MVQGVYQFELKVTDNNGATGRDTMQVTVNAATNIAPVANAGSNSTITLPVNTTSLAGSGSDADGTIVSYIWAKISGPTTYNIVNASSPVTDVSGLVQGVYQFELTVTDNHGATGIDTIQVTVNAAANIPPVANAGQDQTITLPTNAALLNGSGTDADGTIAGYSWEQISGPSVSWIASSNTRVTLARNLVAGTYEFELTVTDNMGAIGKDTVVVVVLRLNLDVQSNNIKIYPNPVANTATLEINTTTTNSKLLVVITNMQGQIVYRNELASGQNNIQDIINISNLSKGTYALTVYFSDQEKQTIKVIRMD
jgi:ribosomal protein L14